MLLTSYLDLGTGDPRYEIIELFSGASRITRLAKSCGLSACGHDITFDDNEKSCFNLNESAGFLFLGHTFQNSLWLVQKRSKRIGGWMFFQTFGVGEMQPEASHTLHSQLKVFLLDAYYGNLLQQFRTNQCWHFGQGPPCTRRYYQVPFCLQIQLVGLQVLAGKMLVGISFWFMVDHGYHKNVAPVRSMLLALLVICARGTVLIENPDNSMINLQYRFRWMAKKLKRLGIPVPWWNLKYGFSSQSCKNTIQKGT